MTREELEKYISEEYGVGGEYPWIDYPENEVFRHNGNKKWFALLMRVSEDKLGKPVRGGRAPKVLDILNVKCDPILIGSIVAEDGFYPAYHMNKEHWLSIAIENVDDEETKDLLDMSFGLTKERLKKSKEEK